MGDVATNNYRDKSSDTHPPPPLQSPGAAHLPPQPSCHGLEQPTAEGVGGYEPVHVFSIHMHVQDLTRAGKLCIRFVRRGEARRRLLGTTGGTRAVGHAGHLVAEVTLL